MNEIPQSLNSMNRSRALATLGVVVLIWLGLLGLDWFMRFHWFNWHQGFIWKPAAGQGGPFKPNLDYVQQDFSGGDLTRLIGNDIASAPYVEPRQGGRETTDAWGYRNFVPLETNYPVVVAGDSFMNTGYPMTNMFSAWLSKHSGVPVYNFAFPGRGPFWGMVRLFVGDRFRDPPPKVVVWGLLERDLAGAVFGGMIYQIWLSQQPEQSAPIVAGGIRWREFLPGDLKISLPASSIIAQKGQLVWNRLYYHLFGQLATAVVPAQTPHGEPLLFYRNAIDAMRWSPETRGIGQVLEAICYLHDRWAERGVELVILLIPDKEETCREFLPASEGLRTPPMWHDFLPELEKAVTAKGITVVNLLEPFRQELQKGQLFYWRDDTHWNPPGIALAAELTWSAISNRCTNRLPIE